MVSHINEFGVINVGEYHWRRTNSAHDVALCRPERPVAIHEYPEIPGVLEARPSSPSSTQINTVQLDTRIYLHDLHQYTISAARVGGLVHYAPKLTTLERQCSTEKTRGGTLILHSTNPSDDYAFPSACNIQQAWQATIRTLLIHVTRYGHADISARRLQRCMRDTLYILRIR